jgi:hypothetical protein
VYGANKRRELPMIKTKPLVAALAALALTLGVTACAAGSSATGPSADITHNVYSVVVLNPQHVRVFTTWHNIGTAAGAASCAMDVTAYDTFGDEIGSGVGSTGTNSLAPGQTVHYYQDIVVTDNNAAGVTSTKDVSIVDC